MREEALKKYGNRCNKCGATDNLTLDHILPLSEGGLNVISNIQILCRDCNSRKANFVRLPLIKHIRAIWTLRDYCQKWKNEMSAIQSSISGITRKSIEDSEKRITQLVEDKMSSKVVKLLEVIKQQNEQIGMLSNKISFQDNTIKLMQECLKIEYKPEETTVSKAKFIKIKKTK